jgi:hypothetical protein
VNCPATFAVFSSFVNRVTLYLLLVASVALGLTGCANYRSNEIAAGDTVRMFGFVTVEKPLLHGPDAMDVTGLKVVGLRFEEGVTIGYAKESWVHVPMDCRMVVIVQDDSQLGRVLDVLKKMEGDALCATVSP